MFILKLFVLNVNRQISRSLEMVLDYLFYFFQNKLNKLRANSGLIMYEIMSFGAISLSNIEEKEVG